MGLQKFQDMSGIAFIFGVKGLCVNHLWALADFRGENIHVEFFVYFDHYRVLLELYVITYLLYKGLESLYIYKEINKKKVV